MVGLLGLSALVTVPLLIVLQRSVLTGGFGTVEHRLADAQAARLSDGLAQETGVLRLLTRLQSVWDDPYEHTVAGDADGLLSDYPPADMSTNYRVSALAVLNSDGELVAGGSTDGDVFGAFPGSLAAPGALSGLVAGSGEDGSCGLWSQGGSLLSWCAHPIVHGDGTGPAAGTLIQFQPVDLGTLGDRLQLELTLADEPGVSGVVTRAIDANHYEIALPVATSNDSSVVLRAVTDRPIAAQARSSMRSVLLATLGLTLVLLASVLVGLEVFVLRRLRRHRDAIGQISGAESEAVLDDGAGDEIGALAAAVNELLAQTRRQAAELHHAGAKLAAAQHEARQIVDAAAHGIDDDMNEIAAGVEQLRSGAITIRQAAGDAEQVIAEAVATSRRAAALVTELHDSGVRISEVTALISEIADQTNLLALNATIEAARAGEAGRGFTVVADEVKNLAGETSESTQLIETRVSEIAVRTEAAVQAISLIDEVMSRVSKLMSQVSGEVEQQDALAEDMADKTSSTRQRLDELIGTNR